MFVGILNLCFVLRCGSWCRFIIGQIAEENRAGYYIQLRSFCCAYVCVLCLIYVCLGLAFDCVIFMSYSLIFMFD